MDLDWCIICGIHTSGGIYCSGKCKKLDGGAHSRSCSTETIYGGGLELFLPLSGCSSPCSIDLTPASTPAPVPNNVDNNNNNGHTKSQAIPVPDLAAAAPGPGATILDDLEVEDLQPDYFFLTDTKHHPPQQQLQQQQQQKLHRLRGFFQPAVNNNNNNNVNRTTGQETMANDNDNATAITTTTTPSENLCLFAPRAIRPLPLISENRMLETGFKPFDFSDGTEFVVPDGTAATTPTTTTMSATDTTISTAVGSAPLTVAFTATSAFSSLHSTPDNISDNNTTNSGSSDIFTFHPNNTATCNDITNNNNNNSSSNGNSNCNTAFKPAFTSGKVKLSKYKFSKNVHLDGFRKVPAEVTTGW